MKKTDKLALSALAVTVASVIAATAYAAANIMKSGKE